MRVLVTGSNGFVGRVLCSHLVGAGVPVRAAVRDVAATVRGDEVVAVGDIDGVTDWSDSLVDITHVVHLAGRAHIVRESALDPESAFWTVNTDGTRRLAEQAAAQGVRRMVFVSSVKACAERTSGTPLAEDSTPCPEDPYGRSKLNAERALLRVSEETGLESVSLRSPLVYGPGVRANFLRLMRLVCSGIPLPLASIRNRRSLLYVENLVSAIEICLHHPAAAGGTFNVSDGEDVSTPDLVRRLAGIMGCKARLWPFPAPALSAVARLLGQGPAVDRLVESLALDISRIRAMLGWSPPFSLEQGLAETIRWYMQESGRPVVARR